MAKPVFSLKAQQLRQDFASKSQILGSHYQPLSPLEYYDFIFRDRANRRLYIVENKTYGTASVDDLFDLAMMRADIYIPPCDFFNNFYNLKTLSKLYALVVDIDNVAPLALEELISSARTDRYIEPSLIGNSGSGIHLYFIFSVPVDTFRRRTPILKAMARALGEMYRGYGLVDRNSLIQAYRLPGSRTKLGDIMTGFRSGAAYDALELAHKLGLDASRWERVNTMQKPPDDNQEIKNAQEKSAPPTKLRWAYNGTKLWEYCTWRVFRDTPIGNRYKSMMALAIVGKKCGVGKEAVRTELEKLAALWSERNPENPVSISEVPKAMTLYSSKYGRVSAQQLEEYFGWTFERKIKRRPKNERLKQDEHLERARAVKDTLMKFDKKKAIRDYLKNHPDASKSEVSRVTGLSRHTVIKYWPM